MPQRINPDVSGDEAVARIWNSNEGRAASRVDVASGEVHAVCHVQLAQFLSEGERTALADQIKALMPGAILHVELQHEVQVPAELTDRKWVYHIGTHLRSDRVPMETPLP